jgi:hypothetical protein
MSFATYASCSLWEEALSYNAGFAENKKGMDLHHVASETRGHG